VRENSRDAVGTGKDLNRPRKGGPSRFEGFGMTFERNFIKRGKENFH